jgi:hypothetical protein
MGRTTVLAALALALTTWACPPSSVTPPPPDPEADGGGLDAAEPATCAGWCAHAAALGCAAAKPTPLGASCASVCQNAQDVGVRWNLRCRSSAKSCSAADECEVTR